MKSFSKITYENTTRWDLLTRFGIKNCYDVPKLSHISVRMHEAHPKQHKDRFVLALFLELISGQRVANRLVIKGKYRKSLTVKHNSDTIQVSTTLRGNNLYMFVDKWILYGLPKSTQLAHYKTMHVSKKGGMAFYYNEVLNFPETQKLFSLVHKIGGLQLHVQSTRTNPVLLKYILNSWRVPLEMEGAVDTKHPACYNFFNK